MAVTTVVSYSSFFSSLNIHESVPEILALAVRLRLSKRSEFITEWIFCYLGNNLHLLKSCYRNIKSSANYTMVNDWPVRFLTPMDDLWLLVACWLTTGRGSASDWLDHGCCQRWLDRRCPFLPLFGVDHARAEFDALKWWAQDKLVASQWRTKVVVYSSMVVRRVRQNCEVPLPSSG